MTQNFFLYNVFLLLKFFFVSLVGNMETKMEHDVKVTESLDVAMDTGLDVKVDETETIILKSKEGTEFVITKRAAKQQSELLQTTIEGDPNATVIDLELPLRVLTKAVAYFIHHENNEAAAITRPLKTVFLKDSNVSQWDCDFAQELKDDHPFLIEMMNAANFLSAKQLLELCSATMASEIKGKTPDQIKEEFPESVVESKKE